MKRILVIEDTPMVQVEILTILTKAGFEVSSADNGRAGLEQARLSPPDLVLCDVMMPGLDGYGVLAEMRKNPATASIPFVFLTAVDGRAEMRRGMNLGADDYLTKPFRVQDLLDAVHSRLERQETVAQRFAAEIHRTTEQLDRATHYDVCTGLPNRSLLRERLGAAITANRSGKSLGLFVLRIDRFRDMNDALGPEAGDAVLKIVAERIVSERPAGASVFRSGDGEFSVLLPALEQHSDAIVPALAMLHRIRVPATLGAQELHITASIGIGVAPADGTDAETLLTNASLAMQHAKERGRNTYQFFSASLKERAFDRLTLENSLRRAMERHELHLEYQPQVDIGSGRVLGMEALARWQISPTQAISPGRFIPVAEDSGLILPLGEWSLRTACAQAREFQKLGFPGLHVTVNMSGHQLQEENVVDIVAHALRLSGLPPPALIVELTESVVMRNPAATIVKLEKMKGMGVRIAIDDFGTGYSSLAYLKRFPIDTLKIDQSFVRDITSGPEGSAIVTAIIQLAHSLKLEVVAEGVETAEQLAFLRAQGCDGIQGWLFSKALPSGEFLKLLQDDRRLA